jgi:hypothetical protein
MPSRSEEDLFYEQQKDDVSLPEDRRGDEGERFLSSISHRFKIRMKDKTKARNDTLTHEGKETLEIGRYPFSGILFLVSSRVFFFFDRPDKNTRFVLNLR